MKTTTLLALASVALSAARGATVFDSFGPGARYANNNPDPIGALHYRLLAVPFTPSNTVFLESLTVAMSHFSGENAVRLTVRPNVAGVPGDRMLDTLHLGGFPAAPECVILRSCTTNVPGLGAVGTVQSRARPLLEAGVTYWVVAEPRTAQTIVAWHGTVTPTYGRAYDIGQGLMTDLESTYALRVDGTAVDVDELIALVKESGLSARRQHPLLVTLRAARRAFADGRCKLANKYLLVFQRKVRAQVPDVGLAGEFLGAAQAIIDRGCAGAAK